MSNGRPVLNAATEGLIHITIPVGMLQCNCSIIGDPLTHEALVVDPGDEVNRILDLLGRHKLTIKAIVSTHAHIDHVGGLSKLHQYTGAPVLMQRDDLQLFSGDTLFAGSIGRTDLWGGSMEQILDSLRSKLMHLPDETVVYPGHGPVTSIGSERHLNPFLQPE